VVPGEAKRKSHRARGHPSKSGKMAGMEAVVGRLVSHGRGVKVMGSRMQGFINRKDNTSAKINRGAVDEEGAREVELMSGAKGRLISASGGDGGEGV